MAWVVIISIHAPTRGATKKVLKSLTKASISIHAPTRGATSAFHYPYIPPYNFNPRSHERSDFSIISSRDTLKDFNPRSHERSDCLSALFWIRFSVYFNPRSHERSDSNIAQKICLFLYNTDNKYIIR